MNMNVWVSRIAVIAALAAGIWVATGCTIVRYVDDDDDGVVGPPPKVVDMLVMMDMSRSTANLAGDYGTILAITVGALAKQNVTVRRAALAPLYSRSDGAVPLLYGENDESGEFVSFEEAIAFYTYDDGAAHLQDAVQSDSENLATLGKELDTRAVYHPTTADTAATPYFEPPADGFVVLYFSASPRRCSMGGAPCAVDGQNAADYFTSSDGSGVEWLELGGGASLPRDKVFHGAIVTAEGVDYDTFYDVCASYPQFPAGKLDVMQPSEQHAYFGPLVEGIKSAGGPAHYVDLCEAMSANAEAAVIGLAAKIRGML